MGTLISMFFFFVDIAQHKIHGHTEKPKVEQKKVEEEKVYPAMEIPDGDLVELTGE